MAGKRGIRIRISHQRLEALLELCRRMEEEFNPANDHQQLLMAYLHELRDLLRGMAARNQHLYTLMLCDAEAIAFYQLWNMLDISEDKYARLVVDNLIRKMNAMAA